MQRNVITALRSDTLLTIINVISPVFLLIGLGWALLRWNFLPSRTLHDLNRLCYWVALPAMLFHRIGGATPDFAAAGGMLKVMLAATLLGIATAGVFAWLSGMARASRGAFIHGVFRGNIVFVGLPVVVYAFDATGGASSNIETAALLIIGPMIVIYNIMAVAVLLFSAGNNSPATIRTALQSVITNPLLLACAAGLLFSASDASLPVMAGRTLGTLGAMAFPLALICIGGALYLTPIRGNLALTTTGALMKVAMLPAFGMGLAAWMGLSSEQTTMAVIMLASPTAAASYVLTLQLRGDEAMVSGIILLSHILAVPALILLLAIGG